MPKIEDTADGGFLRRFIGIKFPNKFVDNPTKPNEFKKDTTLKIKIKNNPEWHQQWMLLMLEYYRIYKQNNRNIVIPKKVKDNTQKLVNNQDIVKDYITTTLIISDDKDEYMSLTELYNSYISFHTSATKDTKPLSKKDFMERLLILWESEIDNGNIIHKETYKKKKDCFMGVSNKDTNTDSE
jgi:phage/plasmid-associated DNA primase